jgi:hypothetical protein
LSLTDDEIAAIYQRGADAQALLDSAGVMDSLHRMSERIISDWRNSARSAPTLRDEQHAQVAAIDALVALWKRDVDDASFLRSRLAKSARR